jgi:hypothetical protein
MTLKNWALGVMALGVLALSTACNQTIQAGSPLAVIVPTVQPTFIVFPVFTPAVNTTTVTPTSTWTPLSTPTPLTTVTCPFALVAQWGSSGSGSGQFSGATDLTVDSSGNVYVLDTGNKRVQEFTSGGVYILQWNDTSAPFYAPSNIGFDPADSRICVLDSTSTSPYSGVMKLFDAGATIYPGFSTPSNPMGMAIDPSGNIYIGDQGKAIKYDQNGANPKYYYNHGINGSPFPGVLALAVDPSGDLFVGAGAVIEKFDPTGRYLLQWGTPGSGQGQFTGLAFMCADSQGNVYVVDNYLVGGVTTGRIQKFDTNGNFICSYLRPGTLLQGIRWTLPGNLYVLDGTNQQVLKF